jgi:hypothetical protein
MVMDPKEHDLPTQYKLLQETVNQSSLHTKRQLGTISGNTYIGGFILLALALGITYFLNIFEYWIPAGFLLFYFLAFTALRSLRAPFIEKDSKDVLKHYKEKPTEITYRTESCLQKNLAIIMQSLAILYVISFFILLSIEYNWIATTTTIAPLLPALTCLLFLPVPFFIKDLHQLFQPSEIKASLQKIIQKHKNSLSRSVFTWGFLKPFFFGFYLILLLLLPLLSLWNMYPIITQWPSLLLILLLQCFMIILFANSFSANTVRKELTTTITTYADINYLLSMAQLHQHYTTAEYQRLQTLYQSAKPYDVNILDTFKFINYYMLIPNRFYLKELLEHTRENTPVQTPSPAQHHREQPSYSPPVQKEQPRIPQPTPIMTRPLTAQPPPTTTHTEPVKQPQPTAATVKTKKDIDDIKIGKIGILVYGPASDDLSPEIKSALKKRITNIHTPFKVELARKNDTRGGAPELVPVSTGGASINADLLIFKDTITEHQVLDMLYRRENHLEGTKKTYRKPTHPTSNTFVIKILPNFYGIDKVFYPSIGRNINQITPKKLAQLTINSVFNAEEKGADGFTYLLNLKKHGIITPMIKACEEEILNQTFSESLWESRKKLEEVKTIKLSIK